MARWRFQEQETEQFRQRMCPHIVSAYKTIWGDRCERHEARGKNGEPHYLDKYWGIDAAIYLPWADSFVMVQEKVREHSLLTDAKRQVTPGIPDFTQNFCKGKGTAFEREGEWRKLAAQCFFYGWATPREDGLSAWVLIDVLRYKALVNERGGLAFIGKECCNSLYSKTSFYAIPVVTLRDCWIASQGLDGLPD